MFSAPDLSLQRQTWVEIDLEAFARNVDAIEEMLPEDSRLIAVLKADAYGHGAVELARICEQRGAAMIAVSMLEEALELRRADITLPILILGALDRDQIARAANEHCSVAIVSPEVAHAVRRVVEDDEIGISVHVKLDTGMGRMGLTEDDLASVVEDLRSSGRILIEAIYTHYANASDPNDPFTDEQTRRFEELLAKLRELGVDAPLHHTCNSAATVRKLVRPGDFARVGIALYGGEPLDFGGQRLEPVMRWRSEIARLKTIPPGHGVGYGTTFHAKRPTDIATIPVGYADGYNRLLSNCGEVLIRGKRAPVVGRVSMDLITVDVTDIDEVALGDEVVLLGRSTDDEISAEEIASKIGTISYEVFCNVSARVPRLYVNDGRARLSSKYSAFLTNE